MRIIAMGDTHGRSFWKQVALNEKYDKLVFIGDYWDSYDIPYIQQLHNFREICRFKEDNPDKVVLLIGNHDFHYLPIAGVYKERYSGYQRAKAMEIGHVIQEYLHLFQMAYKWENYLFTHAGVTNRWLKSTMGMPVEDTIDREVKVTVPDIEEYINDVWKYKPVKFLFNGNDPYGDDVTQSPIWVRPQSLNEDALPEFIQVVGHTGMKRIGVGAVPFLNGGEGFFIDTLGTSHEYLIITDEGTEIGSVFGHKDIVKYPSTDFDSIQ